MPRPACPALYSSVRAVGGGERGIERGWEAKGVPQRPERVSEHRSEAGRAARCERSETQLAAPERLTF